MFFLLQYKKTILNQKISCKIYINNIKFPTKYTGELAWKSTGGQVKGAMLPEQG